MVSVDSTSSASSCLALTITSDRAQSSDSETDAALRRSIARILPTGDLVDGVGKRGRVGDELADAVPQELRVEKLLRVFPFVERLALVEPLVALQADERARGDLGQRFRQLGLADSGGTLDQDRAAHARREVHHRRDATRGDVLGVTQTVLDLLD